MSTVNEKAVRKEVGRRSDMVAQEEREPLESAVAHAKDAQKRKRARKGRGSLTPGYREERGHTQGEERQPVDEVHQNAEPFGHLVSPSARSMHGVYQNLPIIRICR